MDPDAVTGIYEVEIILTSRISPSLEAIKLFFVLNSSEHEILTAHKN